MYEQYIYSSLQHAAFSHYLFTVDNLGQTNLLLKPILSNTCITWEFIIEFLTLYVRNSFKKELIYLIWKEAEETKLNHMIIHTSIHRFLKKQPMLLAHQPLSKIRETKFVAQFEEIIMFYCAASLIQKHILLLLIFYLEILKYCTGNVFEKSWVVLMEVTRHAINKG